MKVKETAHKALKEIVPGRKHDRARVALLKLLRLDSIVPSVEALRYQWSGIYRWVAADYVSGPYPGKLTLFWSSEASPESMDWRILSQGKVVEEYVFPGTHMSCKNENLHIVAERLRMCLNEVQEAPH